MLLGEILEYQIGKNTIFHIKKVIFFETTKFAVSAWSIDQKTPENPQNLVKRGQKFNIFGKSTLLNRGFSLKSRFYRIEIVRQALLLS